MNSREIAVLSSLGPEEQLVSQRQLARRAGVSVGMVNAVLKRMAGAGYVKVRALNKRQLSYCLTPKGIVEVSRRSYGYLLRTVREYQALQQQIYDIVCRMYQEGYRYFAVHGAGGCYGMVMLALGKLRGITITSCTRAKQQKIKHVIINVDESPYHAEEVRVVNLLEEVTEHMWKGLSQL